MKALIYDAPQTLRFQDVPMPAMQERDVLVRVEAVGICGSDMHAFLGHDSRRPAPLILGHEAAGVIEEGPEKGQRVTINPLVSCGDCAACHTGRENLCPQRQIISMPPREGAFAQFVAIPPSNLVTVPEDIALTKASLAEPLAVGWHAARLGLEALHPAMEPRALVLGGGAIGLASYLCLRAQGLPTVDIVEPNPERAEFLSAHCDARILTKPDRAAPLVVDAVGIAATRAAASTHVEPGGVVTHIGLGDDAGGLDIRRMTLQEVTFIGTYTYSMQDFRDTAQALFAGELGALEWFEERPLASGPATFEALQAGNVAAPKVILAPWD
ncbi:alcohol dehydrogenase catalytic domain-containing protein [Shimia sp. R9_3]|uniref:alcohol dehydrogenase catalytic domain-containing protein n=1 Tax=Shimia sp. R9_3 TaxID=2821113 RepID=UPI001ADAC1F4|nr:alcohol dehydrogenase catalytic domain-containing protein [Shimia sp. R9_3]MBO9400360.1 alcohol dehydrogenase catalytic domain-containing protein [Shimia sp. R9_3]